MLTAPADGGTPVVEHLSITRLARIRRGDGGMGRLVLKRVLMAIPVLWGVTFLTFLIMNALPGDAASALLGANATPAEVHALAAKLHLNEPFWVRYWHWLTGAVQGNLGNSLANQHSVVSIITSRLPVTLELIAYAFVMAIVIAVPVATLTASKPGGIIDRISMLLAMLGLSMANFILALLLILILAVKSHVFPAVGWVAPDVSIGGNLRALTLPAASIGVPLACFYTRLLRADIIEQLDSQDYVVTARAKGLSKWRVLIRHALRNSLFGLITLIGLNLGTLIGVTVVIEQIFAIPGIGNALLTAINQQDVPVIEGAVLFFAVAVVVCNLVADMLNNFLDPRIRDGRPGV